VTGYTPRMGDNGPVMKRYPLLAALLAVGLSVGGGAGWALTQAGSADVVRPAAVAAPALSVARTSSGLVDYQKPLVVTASDGSLASLRVTDALGRLVEGALRDGRWASTDPLVPEATYYVTALVQDRAERMRTLTLTTRTTKASRTLKAVLSPGTDRAVGIGLPAIVNLNRSVRTPADRKAVAARLSVETVPAVAGAWRWMSDRELHYRGPTYWKKGTRIHVRADFTGLRLSDGTWGSGVRDTRYHVGRAVVATVDVANKSMVVTVDGKVVRTVKVSTGRDKYPTKGGVHLVLEKTRLKIMDSATVGIPRNSPEGYYEKVPNSVRISYSGEFVHSAGWSVRDQGVRNVSHGCVNVSPSDAAWFYDLVKRGDVVNVVNAKAPPLLYDPGMSDWNIPFSTWAN
jgi:lipoprotein-anchoring transpeptidase ErfK/SrfK